MSSKTIYRDLEQAQVGTNYGDCDPALIGFEEQKTEKIKPGTVSDVPLKV